MTSFPSVQFDKTSSYQKLKLLSQNIISLKNEFAKDPTRAKKYSILTEDIYFDFSKNLINNEIFAELINLANECKVSEAIKAMFAGEYINQTENRAVLHIALRKKSSESLVLDWEDILPKVHKVLEKMKNFSERIISWERKWYTGKTITNIVNIWIGGSDLGPVMVTEALKFYKNHLNIYFVSNIDWTHIYETLKNLDPETTLFLIASKTFTTQETMTNADSARDRFLASGANNLDVAKHFVAISTNWATVKEFGIDTENMFEFWDWVGGRYSLRSAVGLSIVLAIWYEKFEELLAWANAMDEHFASTEFSQNISIILALLWIWYNNFLDAQTLAILPYDQYLSRFAAYFQQWDMESNGKSVDRNGKSVNYETWPVIWWEPGTNWQHAFYQLIHQWTKLIPCDFLAPAVHHHDLHNHHDILMSNFFAQTEALMNGKNIDQVIIELKKAWKSEEEIDKLAPYMTFVGNKPTNSIIYRELTPYILGQLIAMYEHKIFVQWVIWNIYSFDQFGVELGKQLAKKILPELTDDEYIYSHDDSTNWLINQYKNWRNKK